MINTTEIKKIIDNLKNIKDNYYDIFINYYNSIEEIKDYWTTNKGITYYNIISEEKKNISLFIYNLDDFLQLFLYLIEEYNKIGNKINYDISLESRYINLKNNLTNYLKDIINIYNNINLSNSNEIIINLVEKEKNKLKKFQNNLDELCEDNREILQKIESIEKTVNSKSSKININIIEVTNIKDYTINSNKNINIAITESNKMQNIYNKIQMYIQEEENILKEINEIFINLSENYKTNNLNTIEKLESEIIINISNILKIHNLNLEILEKEIISIEELERITANNFKNIIN